MKLKESAIFLGTFIFGIFGVVASLFYIGDILNDPIRTQISHIEQRIDDVEDKIDDMAKQNEEFQKEVRTFIKASNN